MTTIDSYEQRLRDIDVKRRQLHNAVSLAIVVLASFVGNVLLLSILVLAAGVQPTVLILLGGVWAIFLLALLRLPAIRVDYKTQTYLSLGFGLLLACSTLLYQFGYPQLDIAQRPDDPAQVDYVGHDSMRYVVWTERVAELWKMGGSYMDANMPLAQVGFPIFFAGLYFLLGVEPLFFILVNSLAVALAAICTYEVAAVWRYRPLSPRDRTPRIAALLLLFSPLVIVQGAAIPMKEALVLFLVMAGVLAIERLHERFSVVATLILALTVLSLLDMRFYMVLVLALYAAYRLGARYLNLLRLRNIVFIVILGLVAAALGSRVLSGPLNSVLQDTSGSYMTALTSYNQSGSITAALFWRGSLALSFLIPVRAAALLFNPLPPIYFADYHVGSESANVIFVLLLLPFANERIRQAFVHKAIGGLGYLLPLILGLCVVSALLPVSSPRFLVPLVPFYTILAAQGIVYCRSRWRVTYVLWLIGLGLLAGLLYMSLKLIL